MRKFFFCIVFGTDFVVDKISNSEIWVRGMSNFIWPVSMKYSRSFSLPFQSKSKSNTSFVCSIPFYSMRGLLLHLLQKFFLYMRECFVESIICFGHHCRRQMTNSLWPKYFTLPSTFWSMQISCLNEYYSTNDFFYNFWNSTDLSASPSHDNNSHNLYKNKNLNSISTTSVFTRHQNTENTSHRYW